MRMSQLFLRTLRDDPADADVDSHKLLVRAGYMRKVAAGMYSWLPLGHRVLLRVVEIVRDEMDSAGAQEVTLPIVQPLESWARSGRDVEYGPLMFRLEDRKGTGYCLAPTAEEVMTELVAGEYSSYRDLPVNLYQINWKYRDELRPRFGLLRAREFLMKDAYSFAAGAEELRAAYDAMYRAYDRIFDRCGLSFRAVEAQAGEIGGDVSHEFMAIASVGEDDFVWCTNCDYAANVEAARRRAPERASSTGERSLEKIHTPDLGGIEGVARMLEVPTAELLKCIAFDVDGDLGIALVPGDRELNEHALARALPDHRVRLYDDSDFAASPEVVRGYLGPHNAAATIVVADHSVAARSSWVTGANEVDYHVRNAEPERDFSVDLWADLATVASGDPCPRCGEMLSVDRGIEVGHVFQLGTKYSEALGARYLDESGETHPMLMGCYGIGISRIVAAVAEQHHDEHGLAWPGAVAPFDVHLIALGGKGEASAQVLGEADAVYEELVGRRMRVLYDDRDVRPGVKFADADLIGLPVQLVVGAKGLANGIIEMKVRASGQRQDVLRSDVAGAVSAASEAQR